MLNHGSGAIKSTRRHKTATAARTRPAPKGADLRMRLPLGGRLTSHLKLYPNSPEPSVDSRRLSGDSGLLVL